MIPGYVVGICMVSSTWPPSADPFSAQPSRTSCQVSAGQGNPPESSFLAVIQSQRKSQKTQVLAQKDKCADDGSPHLSFEPLTAACVIGIIAPAFGLTAYALVEY